MFLASAQATSPLRLSMGDGNPWPPYSYFTRDAQGQVQAESVNGFAIHQLNQAIIEQPIDVIDHHADAER